MNYNWNWGIFWELSPDGAHTYFQTLLLGTRLTLMTAMAAWAMALGLGAAIGVLRTLPHPWLARFGAAYVELFRNMPLLVQMFLWYFVLPEVVPPSIGTWLKQLPDASFYTGVIALGFYTSARVAEQVRAGIAAVGIHLMPAALATGLRPLQAFRLVLLPLGLRAIVGPLTSEFLITVKMSAISLTIGVLELTAQSRHIENYTFQGLEAFTVATVVYLLLGLTVTGLMRVIDGRVGGPKLRRAPP